MFSFLLLNYCCTILTIMDIVIVVVILVLAMLNRRLSCLPSLC